MSQEGKATTAPATQDPPSLLQPGSLVEVNPRDNDYLGAWYLAVIVERATSTCDDRYVVQLLFLYEDISTGTKAIREYNSVDIRPLPPRHRPRKFKVGDLVEAYYRFGWFEGEIVEELHNGNYICQLKSSKRLELVVERLRLQRSWRDGEWIPPLDESELAVEEEDSTEKMMESETDNAEASKAGTGNILEESDQKTKEKEEEFSEGAHVEVTNIDGDGSNQAWFAATIVKPVGNNRYLIRFETLRTEDDTGFLEKEMDSSHIRPPPPHIPVPDQFKMFDHVEVLYKGGWWKGVIAEVLPDDSKYLVFLANYDKLECKHSDLRPRQGSIDEN
ncbi:protein AGENET DOMAIN (AGD)-CONTAINING P1 isoform X1 [Gossypium hirsutum]|uniref:Protein AGENET DOMAIN (AGD)-CONTAINING P1 isoform X1 n=2 Tax=Gossypium TaxID=3633 RepID=A0ABM2ZUX1_GOSHI|nr:protein AGENET DOMAIN (AGD)-CONTAINING P1-like isoform X1 [Gossypium hirsutum]